MDFDALRKAQRADLNAPQHSPKATRPAGGDFAASFAKASQIAPVDEPDWTQHLTAIEDASAKFGAQGSADQLIAYKQAVRAFLEDFLARSHKRRRLATFDPQAEHDLVLLVRTIDGRLEDLSAQFIRQEGDQLQLLSLIDEIRGMLLDLSA